MNEGSGSTVKQRLPSGATAELGVGLRGVIFTVGMVEVRLASLAQAHPRVSRSQLCVAVNADNGEIVVSAKFLGLVLFPEKHALAAVTPSLEVVWDIRVLDKPHRMISLDDVVPTHDRRSSFSVSFAGGRHRSGTASTPNGSPLSRGNRTR